MAKPTLADAPGTPQGRTQNAVARFQPAQDTDQAALHRILEEIEALGLTENLLQLETHGYTVLKGVLPTERIERAKAAILRRVEKQANRRIDPLTATTEDFNGMAYQHYLLFDDPVFEEILLEPKPLALMNYLLGESCVLSSMGCHFRGPGGMPLPVHSDGAGPEPFHSVSMVANCNYALTPYSQEAGALIMFPGSHLKQRSPTPHENWTCKGQTLAQIMARNPGAAEINAIEWDDLPGGVTMEIDPGDAVVWHGNTWHAGHRRELPGVRMNVATYFCRPQMSAQERRGDERFAEVFARHANDPRFAKLLGASAFNGWREEGPDFTKYTPRGRYD